MLPRLALEHDPVAALVLHPLPNPTAMFIDEH